MLLKATGQKNLKTFPSETKLLKKCGLHIKIEIQIRVIGKAGGFMYRLIKFNFDFLEQWYIMRQ